MPPHCADCRHFCGDAHEIERALPGLTAMSSAQGATISDDGLCRHHDRLQSARGSCRDFAAVGAMAVHNPLP